MFSGMPGVAAARPRAQKRISPGSMFRARQGPVDISQGVGQQQFHQQAGVVGQGLPVVVGIRVSTGVKFPSLWVVAGHYGLLNFTPLRMLSVWFQPTEVDKVITWERLFMLHELHAQGVSISAIVRLLTMSNFSLLFNHPIWSDLCWRETR